MVPEYHNALSKGTRLESFEISDVLGVGGFGITYRAYDHSLEREVAIKEYLPDGLAARSNDGTTLNPRSEGHAEDYEYGLTRFLDEARTLAKFHDPAIVRVNRYLEDNGTAYLVMDYEQGQSLGQHLKEKTTLPEDEIVGFLIPVLRGLRTVHSKDFLHRDIKPANIFLRETGLPVLLDFGAARQALGKHTQAVTAMVTPGYAPFEQYHTKDILGPWSDLYGIGATAYHCIAGFAPPAATERVAAIHDDQPDPIGVVFKLARRRYSSMLIDNIVWMLQPHAKERPQNVNDVLEALGDVIEAPVPQPEATDDRVRIQGPFGAETSWEPAVLKSVEVSLEQAIGPLAKALVRKAAQNTTRVDDLTALLTRFIPHEMEEQKTMFVDATRVVREVDAPAPQVISEPQPQVIAAQPVAAAEDGPISHEVGKMAEKFLLGYLGPVAKILVKKAAARTTSYDEFVAALARELRDEEQRSEFRKTMRSA